jgi:tetratricopeptide (TPR) repeat protein
MRSAVAAGHKTKQGHNGPPARLYVVLTHSNSRTSGAPGGGNGRRLLGWKAIGQFLGCTERTARRWESDRALPVHRIPGGGRRAVWAHADELSTWLETLPSEVQASLRAEQDLEEPGPPEALAETPPAAAPMAPPETPPAAAPIAPPETPPAAAPIAPPDMPPAAAPSTPPVIAAEPASAESRWPLWRVSAVVLGLLLLAVAVFDYRTRDAARPAETVSTAYDDNPEARSTYMNARFELSTRSANGLNSAERGFRQLVERYPERAAGWSGLAETYLLLREFGSMPDKIAYPQAARAARAAIALDPRAASAWLDEAFISWWWQGDSGNAFEEFTTALRLDPNSSRAHHWYATALAARGEFPQALEEIRRARALSPDNPPIVADEAYIRYGAGGQQDEAIATLVRLTQLDPSFESPHFYLSRIYLRAERDADFLREAVIAAQLRGQEDVVAELRLAEAELQRGGRPAMLDQLSLNEAARWQDGKGSAVYVAEYRALAHDRAGMLRWLTIAAESHDHNLPCVYGYPEFASYLKDPDFVAIVKRPK